MRVFIAIDLPQEVKDSLLEAQRQLPAAKLSFAREFHLTLKFLGEVTPAKVEAVKSCLSTVRFKPFSAALSGIGVFPSESYIRVIWVGVEPENGFMQLQQSIDEALEKEFPKDKDFKPHLTLARVKFVSDKNSFVQQLRQVKVKQVKFAVNGFKLKMSILRGREGSLYGDLAVYKA